MESASGMFILYSWKKSQDWKSGYASIRVKRVVSCAQDGSQEFWLVAEEHALAGKVVRCVTHGLYGGVSQAFLCPYQKHCDVVNKVGGGS
eukprot:1275523-Amphidinium_carterae.1